MAVCEITDLIEQKLVIQKKEEEGPLGPLIKKVSASIEKAFYYGIRYINPLSQIDPSSDFRDISEIFPFYPYYVWLNDDDPSNLFRQYGRYVPKESRSNFWLDPDKSRLKVDDRSKAKVNVKDLVIQASRTFFISRPKNEKYNFMINIPMRGFDRGRLDNLMNFLQNKMKNDGNTEISYAVTIGINQPYSISREKNQKFFNDIRSYFEDKKSSFNNSTFLINIFGFFWHVSWYIRYDGYNIIGSNFTLLELDEYMKLLKIVLPNHYDFVVSCLEDFHESKINKMVPYDQIREILKNHAYNGHFFLQLKNPIEQHNYYSLLDSDLIGFSGREKYLEAAVKVINEFSKHSLPKNIPSSLEGRDDLYPDIFSLGYYYKYDEEYMCPYLGNLFDQTVRKTITLYFGYSSYLSEPSFFARISFKKSTHIDEWYCYDWFKRNSFIESDSEEPNLETKKFIRNGIKLGNINPYLTAYEIKYGSIITRMPRRVLVHKSAKKKFAFNEDIKGSFLNELKEFSQSHFHPNTWGKDVREGIKSFVGNKFVGWAESIVGPLSAVYNLFNFMNYFSSKPLSHDEFVIYKIFSYSLENMLLEMIKHKNINFSFIKEKAEIFLENFYEKFQNEFHGSKYDKREVKKTILNLIMKNSCDFVSSFERLYNPKTKENPKDFQIQNLSIIQKIVSCAAESNREMVETYKKFAKIS